MTFSRTAEEDEASSTPGVYGRTGVSRQDYAQTLDLNLIRLDTNCRFYTNFRQTYPLYFRNY